MYEDLRSSVLPQSNYYYFVLVIVVNHIMYIIIPKLELFKFSARHWSSHVEYLICSTLVTLATTCAALACHSPKMVSKSAMSFGFTVTSAGEESSRELSFVVCSTTELSSATSFGS